MPDNAIYYQLAYAATAVVDLAYGMSLVLRARRLDAADAAAHDERDPTPRGRGTR